MPDNTNEQNSIREQKKQAIKKGDVAITSHNHAEENEVENNSASNTVFSIEELLNTKIDNPVIRKLNRLKNVGLTDEMIVNTYNDLAGNVTTESEAISILKNIFDRYVEYISELPNGIVLDPLSGRIDHEASYEQRLEVGILQDPFKGIDLDQKISLDDILNLDRTALEESFKEYVIDYNFFMTHTEVFKKFFDNEENKEKFDNFIGNDAEETALSDFLKDFVEELQTKVAVSKYENDPFLFEITQIEYTLEDLQGRDVCNIYFNKRKEFYNEHPEYIGKVPIRDAEGKINNSERRKFEEYKENYEKLFILSRIDEYKKLTPEEKQNMSQDKRQIILTTAVTALKHYRKNSPEYKEIVSESQDILKEFYPEFDFSNVTSKKQQELFAKFAKKEFGANNDLKNIGFEALIQVANSQIKELLQEYLINDKTHIFDKDFNEISIKMIDKGDKYNAIEKYFVGSKVNLTKEDIEAYDSIYKTLTVQSWLESKDVTLKMRYAALIKMKEEYETQADNPYISSKLKEVNKQLEEFTSEHGNLGLDSKEKFTDNMTNFAIYRDCMINANVMKYYTKDALNAQNGVTYKDLDERHKKAYIRNTLVGLEFVDMNLDFCFSKMVMRRLEQMNTDTKKFITFDKDGKPTINKDLILQEYTEMSEYKYKSFDELLESAQIRKNDYILEKLDKYSKLDAKDFLKLTNKDDVENSITEIEEKRAEANVTEQRVVKTKRGVKRIVRKSDVLNMENGTRLKILSNQALIPDKEVDRVMDERGEEMTITAIDEQKQKVVNKHRIMGENRHNSQLEQKYEEPETDVGDGNDSSNSSSENMEAVIMNDSAVTNALVPMEETSKKQNFGKFLTDIIKKIKNTLLTRKNKGEEKKEQNVIVNDETKNEQSTSNDNKGKNWLQRDENLTSKKQQEIARQLQMNQNENMDTLLEHDEGPSIL